MVVFLANKYLCIDYDGVRTRQSPRSCAANCNKQIASLICRHKRRLPAPKKTNQCNCGHIVIALFYVRSFVHCLRALAMCDNTKQNNNWRRLASTAFTNFGCRRTEICTSFFNNSVLKKNSCLHYLLPRPRGEEAEKLRRPLPFLPQTAITTRFQQSYMIYALNNYQI